MSYQDDGGSASNATLRDYFAAQALQGVLSDSSIDAEEHADTIEEFYSVVTNACYSYADAMLEARKK